MQKKLKKAYQHLLDLTEWIRNHRLKAFLILFALGIVMRFLVLWYYFSIVSVDWNDMNEKVWIAISQYLINGINPYGQTYSMNVLYTVNIEEWYQYPPLTLLIHLPALFWPGPSSIGLIDFMPAFFFIHLIIDFYMFYRLFKAGYHWSGVALWVFAGALFVALDFVTFISVPMLFMILAYLNIDKPRKNALYIGLGIASYTYLVIPALFFIIYQIKKHKWSGLTSFIIGLIPTVIIMLPFLIWNPSKFVYDIIFSQSGRNTAGNFLYPKYGAEMWWLHLFSITPYINTLYNLIVNPTKELYINNLTTVLTAISFLLTIYYIYKFYKKPYRGKLLYWSCLTLLAITLVSAAGFFYYLLLPITILIFLVDQRKDIKVDDYSSDFISPYEKHLKKKLIKEKRLEASK